jgi:hypothetical protein
LNAPLSLPSRQRLFISSKIIHRIKLPPVHVKRNRKKIPLLKLGSTPNKKTFLRVLWVSAVRILSWTRVILMNKTPSMDHFEENPEVEDCWLKD